MRLWLTLGLVVILAVVGLSTGVIQDLWTRYRLPLGYEAELRENIDFMLNTPTETYSAAARGERPGQPKARTLVYSFDHFWGLVAGNYLDYKLAQWTIDPRAPIRDSSILGDSLFASLTTKDAACLRRGFRAASQMVYQGAPMPKLPQSFIATIRSQISDCGLSPTDLDYIDTRTGQFIEGFNRNFVLVRPQPG